MLKKIQYYNSHNIIFNSVTSGLYGFVTAISFGLLYTNFIWWFGMLIVCGINVWLNVLGKHLEKRIIKNNETKKFQFKNFVKSKKGV